MRYLLNLLIATDQLANTLLRGDPDETLSSRAYRMHAKGQPVWWWTMHAINALFFNRDHCYEAYMHERERT